MTDRDDGEDLSRLVGELVTALRDLESELEPAPDRRMRPPSPRELRRFTSEVAIPGVILVLETNIRALRLLQHALEVRERADRTREGVDRVSDRARSVSETSLDRLDDALADLEGAIEGRPPDDEAATLLEEARALRAEVQTRLREYTEDSARRSHDREGLDDVNEQADVDGDDADETSEQTDDDTSGETDELDDSSGADGPQVDVDAELESIKAQFDESADGTDGAGTGTDGVDHDESKSETPNASEPDSDGSDLDGSDPNANSADDETPDDDQ